MNDRLWAGGYLLGLIRSLDGGGTWDREPGALGSLSIESLHVTAAASRTILMVGVAGDLIFGEPARAGARAGQGEFYGDGVYRLTIDHRAVEQRIYLPLALWAKP